MIPEDAKFYWAGSLPFNDAMPLPPKQLKVMLTPGGLDVVYSDEKGFTWYYLRVTPCEDTPENRELLVNLVYARFGRSE